MNNLSAACAVLLLLVSYGIGVLPLTYLYSMLFDNYSTAQISITVFHFITGFIFVMAYYITISIPEVQYIGESLVYLFWFFPPFNVGQGMLRMTGLYYSIYLTGVDESYLQWVNTSDLHMKFPCLK